MDRQMINYLPHVLRDIREFKAIAAAWQPDFEQAWLDAEFVLDEAFIMYASEVALARWERIIGLFPRSTDTLEDRRFVILTAFENQLPYTMRQLERMLAFLCGPDGFVIELDHNNYFLRVLVALTARRNFDAVKSLLTTLVPANLVLKVSLRYNSHRILSGFTHRQLSEFTHHQLRNEVFDDGN